MFNNQTKIEKLTPEVMANISSHLSVKSILHLALASKSFKSLMNDELIFRKLSERDFGVTEMKEKQPTWVELYKHLLSRRKGDKDVEEEDSDDSAAAAEAENDAIMTEVAEAEIKEAKQQEDKEDADDKSDDDVGYSTPDNTINDEKTEPAAGEQKKDADEQKSTNETTEHNPSKLEVAEGDNNNNDHDECPHLEELSNLMKEIKRILYKSTYRYPCDICHQNPVEYLNMSITTHSEACSACLIQADIDDDDHYPIQLHLESGELYCFKCDNGKPRKLTAEKDGEEIKAIIDYIKAPESADDIDRRRKAEQQLYIQELRREDMSLKHYLVEKQWGRTWMMFRTREGSPLPTKITNNKLARMNGTLDPNIRLPMDKYRPSPETHGDVISEKLWGYLSKAYGVLGNVYNEDDIIAPEYARLRVYVDAFKKSIDLYP